MFARLERGKRFCHDAAAAEPESTIVFFFFSQTEEENKSMISVNSSICFVGEKEKKKLVSVYTDRFRGAGKSANSNRGTGAFFNGWTSPSAESSVFFFFEGDDPFS